MLEDDMEDLDLFLTDVGSPIAPKFERELPGRMGEVRLGSGAVQFGGWTSNLLFLNSPRGTYDIFVFVMQPCTGQYDSQLDAFCLWAVPANDKT